MKEKEKWKRAKDEEVNGQGEIGERGRVPRPHTGLDIRYRAYWAHMPAAAYQFFPYFVIPVLAPHSVEQSSTLPSLHNHVNIIARRIFSRGEQLRGLKDVSPLAR